MRGHCEIGFIVQHAAMNLFLIFQYGLIGLLVVLVTLFSSVMFCETCEGWVGERLGLYTKNPILKFLGIGMGGVLLALQALMSYKRAKALEDTANAQAAAAQAQAAATKEQAKANQNTEQGQRQERLKNAIEHLGHDSASVRLGGAYELFHLAEDTTEDKKDLRQTVLDILCAYIRQTTGKDKYQKEYKSKPSEEIQSLLTLLFVQEHEVFKGLHINLQGSCLNGANLRGAYLEKADLIKTQLQRADLLRVQLRGAKLFETQLQGVMLAHARLQGAMLSKAKLQGAWLGYANMQGADLSEAWLQGANLSGAKLQETWLGEARLQGAWLGDVHLQGADLSEAQLQGTWLRGARLQGTTSQSLLASLLQWHTNRGLFERRVRDDIGKESDLKMVTFQGGLSREDVDSLIEGLSGEKEKELRGKLEPHIGQPVSHELPKNSGAITGTYTAEEAEQWIAEYNEAMAEVPTESDN